MADDKKNVVPFDQTRRVGPRSRLTVAREPQCTHHFFIDRKTRLVSCIKCHQLYDAFGALTYIAEHWPDFQDNRLALRQDIEKLRRERDALLVAVRRLTSQARRLSTKSQNGEPATTAGGGKVH